MDEHAPTDGVLVVCEGGPGAGWSRRLAPGRHLVGRVLGASVRIVDEATEPHHLYLDVSADGQVEVRQLTGRVPCRVDDVPLASATLGTPVAEGSVVVVGASRLRIGAAPPPATPTASTLAEVLRALATGTTLAVTEEVPVVTLGAVVGGHPPEGRMLAVDLPPGSRTTFVGPGATAVARAVIVQLAACWSPGDLRLRVSPELVPWAGRLPHVSAAPRADGAGLVAVVAPGDVASPDAEEAVIVVDERAGGGAEDGRHLALGSLGIGRWWPAAGTLDVVDAHVAGLDEAAALAAADLIAPRAPAWPPRVEPDPALAAAVAGDSVALAARWSRRAETGGPLLGATAGGGVRPRMVDGLVVVGDDNESTAAVLRTLAVGELAARGPSAVDLIAAGRWAGEPAALGRLVASAGPDWAERLRGALERRAESGGRLLVVVGADAWRDGDDEPQLLVRAATTDGVAVVVGGRPGAELVEHVWPVAAEGLVLRIESADDARRLAGTARGARLGPGFGLWRPGPDDAAREVIELAPLGPADFDLARRTLDHAADLLAC